MAIVELAEYLQNELDKKGWNQADLAAASGLNPSVISRAMSSGRGVTMESLIAIANALGVRPERVFIGAGFFPPDPAQNPDELTEKIIHLVSQMDDVDKKAVLSYCNLVVEESRMRDVADEFLHRYDRLDRVEKMEAQKKLLRGLGLVATSRQGSG